MRDASKVWKKNGKKTEIPVFRQFGSKKVKEESPESKKFCFENYRLDAQSQILLSDEKEVHLAKRPLQILYFLIENRERVVSRDELLNKFWEGHEVYDDALRKTVGAIRKALNDLTKPPKFIETRYGSGYRFIGAVEESEKSVNRNGKSDASINPTETANKSINSEKTLYGFPYVLASILAISLVSLVVLGFYAFRQTDNADGQTNLLNPPPRKQSIAVLPLKNLTGDTNNDYLSDGITESIITELSRLNELKIISRSSTFTFKDKEIKPQDIGKQLAVDSLLEGSLQKKGELFSVSVRLINASDGQILWTSENFERPLNSAYELQNAIACNVANELGRELCGIIAQHPRRNTTSADAYQAYLKGRYYWNKRTGEGIKKSIEFYEQALRFDANYAPAYAGLAESYVQGIWHVPFIPQEVLPKAKNAALKAIELDSTSAEALTALANVYELEWNWSEAEREINRAIELNPRYARAYHVRAFCFVIQEKYDEALASIERAAELDPLNLVISTDKGNLLYAAGRVDEAFAQWDKTLEIDPNFSMTVLHKTIAYQNMGNETAAVESNLKLMQLDKQSPEKIAAFRETVSKHGLAEFYRKELKDLHAKESRGETVSFVGMALYYTLLKQKDEAFDYLEKAYRERSAEMVLLPSPQFAFLRSDPRFKDLIKRIGLSE